MSEENVEIVRRAIEAFNRGDFDAALRDVAPDGTVDMSRSRGPDAGVYVGHDAVRRVWTDMTEPFERFTLVPDEFIPHSEHVVVPMTSRMTGRGGIEVEAKSATVATLHDGRMVGWTMYQDRAEALEAVGLGAQATSVNLDLVRSIYADWERGDFSSARWAHPAIQFSIVGGPDPGSWTGQSGMRTGWFRFLEAWEDFHVNADEYRELDQTRVLVLIRRSGRGRTSQLPVEQMRSLAADVFHILDRKVVQLTHYPDRDHAFADLGLTTEGSSPGDA